MLQETLLPILLIIAHEGYHPVEYGLTRKAVEDAGLTVVVASDKVGLADATPSLAHQELCKEPQCTQVVKDFPQMEFLDNEQTCRLMLQTKQLNKPIGAICVSPRILAKAGVLRHKLATG